MSTSIVLLHVDASGRHLRPPTWSLRELRSPDVISARVASVRQSCSLICWPVGTGRTRIEVFAVANIKSAIKRNRQNEKRNDRNRAIRGEIRTRTRAAIEAAEAGADDTDEKLKIAIKRIDSAVSKGTMHKNTAARTKSRLTKRVRLLQDA